VHRTVLEHLPVGVGACSKQREGRLAYLWSRSLRLRFEFREWALSDSSGDCSDCGQCNLLRTHSHSVAIFESSSRG